MHEVLELNKKKKYQDGQTKRINSKEEANENARARDCSEGE